MSSPVGHILVVDDDGSFRELLSEALETEGFAVRAVGDGREALTLLAQQRFDIVIADVLMPRLDGATLAHVMRMDPSLRAIPLIAISGGEDVDVPEATLMLQKPIDLDELKRHLGRVWAALQAVRQSATRV